MMGVFCGWLVRILFAAMGVGGPTRDPTVTLPAPPAVQAEILLTFDDGPKLGTTPRVLEALDRHQAKAMFFVNGWKFESDVEAQALLRTALEHGHYIGNHTYSHKVLCRHLDIAPVEIDRNQDLIARVLGIRPTFLRTPYGQHCRSLRKLVQERGYTQIGWDIDAQEWRKERSVDRIVRYIISHLERVRGRAILLMHDSREKTALALPKILDWLAQHPEIKIADWRSLGPG